MKKLIWVVEKDILVLHEKLLARFGGSSGIRDRNLLDSAIHRPMQMEIYGEKDIFSMASALATGIIKNHPFLDGNKRTALGACLVFLRLNGVETKPDGPQWEQLVLDVAASRIDREETTKRLGQVLA